VSGAQEGERPAASGAAGAPGAAGGPGAARAPGADGPACGAAERKPAWLRVKVTQAPRYRATRTVLADLALHTVCDEARCPNKSECFSRGTATFLILGDTCTRACRFCAVGRVDGASGRAAGGADGARVAGPAARLDDPDRDEPRRVAAAARRLALSHVVVTSVTRDDLPDGGAGQYAATIAVLRAELRAATVEVLVPDFGGDEAALRAVLAAAPDVFNHNLETVPRLYASVRPQAQYARSLELLRCASVWALAGAATHAGPGAGGAVRAHAGATAGPATRPLVKTGIMLGLGERPDEVDGLLSDCREAGVDVVTIGQYLRPRRDCLPVARFVAPDEFAAWERRGAALGQRVHAAPFVRSSHRAGEVLAGAVG
jgi:lipoic acid synthetase